MAAGFEIRNHTGDDDAPDVMVTIQVLADPFFGAVDAAAAVAALTAAYGQACHEIQRRVDNDQRGAR